MELYDYLRQFLRRPSSSPVTPQVYCRKYNGKPLEGYSMLLELSNQTDAGTHTFSPVDYLLGLIQHAMAAGANTRIILPGKGEITLLPVRGEYYSTVTNMAEFCSVRPTQFEVTTLAETAEPLPYAATSARSIKE